MLRLYDHYFLLFARWKRPVAKFFIAICLQGVYICLEKPPLCTAPISRTSSGHDFDCSCKHNQISLEGSLSTKKVAASSKKVHEPSIGVGHSTNTHLYPQYTAISLVWVTSSNENPLCKPSLHPNPTCRVPATTEPRIRRMSLPRREANDFAIVIRRSRFLA